MENNTHAPSLPDPDEYEGVAEIDLDAPVAALRSSSQTLLSTMLNPIKVLPTETGLPRDWRGLAELAGLPAETIFYLQSKSDPLAELVQLWYKSSESRCRFFSDLKAFLAVIDRYDVIDDVKPLLVKDAQAYREQERRGEASPSACPLDPTVEKNILTIEDSKRIHQGLPLTKYDAFVLYADEDSSFADQVIQKMEEEYKLKLCVKDRDLLPGVMFEHEVIGRLIEERCNRFLVIFSPNFIKSTANHFLVSYAQASALETRIRKIVPCVYEPCELPPSVRFSFCIKYNRAGKLYNFWEKLGSSLGSSNSEVILPARPAMSEKHKTPFTEESLKLWDVSKYENENEKPTHRQPSPPPSYSQSMRDVNSKAKLSENLKGSTMSTHDSTDNEDTLSIASKTNLLAKDKEKKWYKLKNPMKKKNKDKTLKKAQAIAE